MVFAKCWHTHYHIVFLANFYVLAFQGHYKPSKAMSKVWTIICCSKCYQNDFHY